MRDVFRHLPGEPPRSDFENGLWAMAAWLGTVLALALLLFCCCQR